MFISSLTPSSPRAQKKTNLPKTSPPKTCKTPHHSMCCPSIDSMDRPPPFMNELQRSTIDSHPELISDCVLTSLRTRISSPFVIVLEQRPCRVPPKNVTMSSEDLAPHQEPHSNKNIRTSIPQNNRNRDVCPHNGPGLSSHSPQSGGKPVHLSPLPYTGSKWSPRRQNTKEGAGDERDI